MSDTVSIRSAAMAKQKPAGRRCYDTISGTVHVAVKGETRFVLDMSCSPGYPSQIWRGKYHISETQFEQVKKGTNSRTVLAKTSKKACYSKLVRPSKPFKLALTNENACIKHPVRSSA